MSWEELESIMGDESEDLALNRDKEVISALFNGDNGREALRIIQSWTVDRPMFPAPEACGDGIIASQLMCIREGENNLFRRIRACVADPVVASNQPAAKDKEPKS